MVFQIISFLGLIIGVILSKKFDYELKNIKSFLKIASLIIIIVLIIMLILLVKINFMFFPGLFIGIAVNYFLKNNYLYYGAILMLSNFIDDNSKILFGMLIFILGLTYPAINKANKKFLIISLVLFALPFIFLLTNVPLNYNSFIVGFSIGGIAIGLKQYYK